MDLTLSRIDYFNVGTTFTNSAKILRAGDEEDKVQEKVAIANQDGVLQVAGWKKIEAVYSCRIPLDGSISALQLGGALGRPRDKVFVASGNIVRGYTKKGKLFLDFDTNLAENIKSMFVMGGHLLVAGHNVYSQFEDCQEAGFMVFDDEITSVIALPIDKVKSLIPVIACKDRRIRVLEQASIKYSISLQGIPSGLFLFNGDGGEGGTEVIFGTLDGKFGLVNIGLIEGHIHWTMDTDVIGGVTSMDFYDLTGDKVKELIIGYDDGSIQVYALDPEDYLSCLPRLLYTYNCHESITSVQGTIFGNKGFEEVLVVTYSGWVFGLTTETTDKRVHVDDGSVSVSEDTRQKILKLRTEIDELQGKVNRQREKYQSATNSALGGMSVLPPFVVNDKMLLSREDASYLLTMEVESPIDTILIQSDVPVDLLDVEKNSAVVSFSKCEPNSGNFLLTTFRCQANTTRIEVRLRTIEGQQGTIQAYITPRIHPKCCQLRSFEIKALSLHVRTHSFDPNRPYNDLSLKGSFSAAEMHSWLSGCVPEIPDRAPSTGEGSLTFVSSFLETMLHCEYKKGEAKFKSDNVSTISILKDFLTKEATKNNIVLEIEWEFNEESVLHTLQLIRPKLDAFLTLAKQVSLIDALKEVATHDPEVEKVLSSEYKYILTHAEELRALHRRQPSYLDRLYGMITDLYIDMHKYNGLNVKSRVPQLMEVLDHQDFDLLVDFFQAPSGL